MNSIVAPSHQSRVATSFIASFPKGYYDEKVQYKRGINQQCPQKDGFPLT